jgi:ribA/ribD-fused uncharacterized protein
VITSFAGPHWFLSNFALLRVPCEVRWESEGLVWPAATVEHGYQACKMVSREDFELVIGARTPGRAKYLGRSLPFRANWNEVKFDVMEKLLRQKFSEPSMQQQLLATGEEYLIEGNRWNDRIWGACPGKAADGGDIWVGENHLGLLLMKVRDELRKERQ